MIQLDSVTKTFGPKRILNHVTLAINTHDRLALLGPNGAGKTTLAKILLGLEEVDSGSVQRSASATVAYLPQEVRTLLLISHDRRLVERLTCSQWSLKEGELVITHTRSLR